MDNGACSYRRFLDGDDNGFVEIVRDYKDGLILFLTGFVRSVSIAEEIMEETFFKLLTKKPKYKAKYSFKTWLYTVARNAAIDHLRKNAKIHDAPIEEMKSSLADESDLEQSILIRERKIAVHRAMRKLNPDYRQALILVYFEDLSSADAAVILKKNAKQMKNLLYRAKGALKAELEKEGFVYEDL